MKQTNKGAQVPAESVERRASMERNPTAEREAGTQSPAQSQQGLERVRAAARRSRTERFTNLLHHLSESMLREAYEALNRKAARGEDGISWSQYGEGLQEKLTKLHKRLQGEFNWTYMDAPLMSSNISH